MTNGGHASGAWGGQKGRSDPQPYAEESFRKKKKTENHKKNSQQEGGLKIHRGSAGSCGTV